MRILILIGAISLFTFFGCSNEDTPTNPPPTTSQLSLNISGLEDLGSSAQYEGWIIVPTSAKSDGSASEVAKSTGVFTVNSNGELSQTNFDVDATDLSNATTFVLTIEPNPDPDLNPSAVHILAGDFSGNSSNVTVNHSAALGSDFMSSTGVYILATPTDGAMTNENSGIWFLDLTSGSPSQGLFLPILPSGWKYEGWTVINGTPVSTGTFTDATVIDDADPYSNTMPGPPFPGEDFLVNAPTGLTFPTDIAGGVAVISIEPSPDNSANPFTLKPLVGDIPANAVDHTTYMMSTNLSSFPT
ncbi:MAG: hypothetical protein KJO12_00290, partial [Ignavibacteria bacterium]|nr:hypothetical protein [Ignavibacteria bacterium]